MPRPMVETPHQSETRAGPIKLSPNLSRFARVRDMGRDELAQLIG
jgi:hypothetical protein